MVVPTDIALAGTTRVYQLIYRDKQHQDGTGVGLSNALKVTFMP